MHWKETFSITHSAKERLVKSRNIAPITEFFQTVCCIYLIKRSHLYFHFACLVLYFHKPSVTPLWFLLRKQFKKTLTALCCCVCSIWFLLLQKAKYTFKVFLSVSRMFLWSTAGLLFYTPPVSENILAPLHGLNGHDREYALKVKTTSVRNWTCWKETTTVSSMTTETKWHLPPSTGMVWHMSAFTFAITKYLHSHLICSASHLVSHLHNQTMHGTVKQSLVSLLFLFLFLIFKEHLCDVRSMNSFAQLPVCRLSIISNKSGQWRWRLKHRGGSRGVLPIVLLLTWYWIDCVCQRMQAKRNWCSWPSYPLKLTGSPIYHFHKGWSWQAVKHTYSIQYMHTHLNCIIFLKLYSDSLSSIYLNIHLKSVYLLGQNCNYPKIIPWDLISKKVW